MPDDKIKISALPSALSLNNTDEMAVVQDSGGTKTTKRSTVQALGSHIAETMNFSSELETTADSLIGAINEAASDKNLADQYSNLITYEVGDFVIYKTVLYKCVTAVTVPEDFDPTKWTVAKVSDLVGADMQNYYTKDETDGIIDGVQDDITELNKFEDAVSYLKEGEPIETTPENTWSEGIWLNKQVVVNASYRYSSEISVTPGQRVYIYSSTPNLNTSMRFIEVYNANGTIIDTVSTDTDFYNVPENAVSLRVTIYSGNYAYKVLKVQTLTYFYQLKTNREALGLATDISTAEAGSTYVLASNIDNKKNCEYSFWGKFSTFTALEIGHGKTEYGGVYLVIDDTNITTYSHTGTQFQQFAHGLTFSDFISISIKVADTYGARATIKLQTNGGFYETTNVIFFGCNGNVYFASTAQMTDVKFGYTIMDLKKDVFVFGDSYIALADNAKWPYYAINNNDNNMLLCGFGGATAYNEIKSFRSILPLKSPKYLCWLLGMNNPDGSVINASWKSCTDEIIEYCEKYDIEIILATIPNTPSMNNMLKNEYVRASGHRYIDFAKAVGAEASGSSWYSGMLSSDNVHPTQDGAKALWLRAILDCPELIN